MKNAFNRRRKINQDDFAYVIYVSHLCKNFLRIAQVSDYLFLLLLLLLLYKLKPLKLL